jgi:hypothetical protein
MEQPGTSKQQTPLFGEGFMIYSGVPGTLWNKMMAVLAVWDKLVSGCISLRTGKFTGNSPLFGP